MNTSKDEQAQVRLQRPERRQQEWRDFCLEDMLPSNHRARLIWQYVEGLNFETLYSRILAVEGNAGRTPVDPKILLALWMFATVEGISSARHVARLCQRDLGYMWICGGVGVNHRLLSDFRSTNPDFFDEVLSETVGTMIAQGLVELDTVAQDGMRVRASAGSSSFGRDDKLSESLKEAQQQVALLRQETDDQSVGQRNRSRQEAAQTRAAEERESRVKEALEQLVELKKRKEKREKGSGKTARCSTTDPDARKMKVASGGYRSCYNVQFVTDRSARVILEYDVSNNGSDSGQMAPLHQETSDRYGRTPDRYLVDGGFTTHQDIATLQQHGTEVYGPIPKAKKMLANGNNPYARQPKDSDEMFAFRQRMATEQAKELLKERPSIAEFPNAECRNRGLQQFRVRGLERVKSSVLINILTYNFVRWLGLTGKTVAI